MTVLDRKSYTTTCMTAWQKIHHYNDYMHDGMTKIHHYMYAGMAENTPLHVCQYDRKYRSFRIPYNTKNTTYSTLEIQLTTTKNNKNIIST